MRNEEHQTVVDNEHLRVLSICYYISAGMTAVTSLFGLFYATVGSFFTLVLSQAPTEPDAPPHPELFGLIFVVIGFGIFAVAASLAILKVLVARRLKQRRSRTFCMFVAGFSCLGVPFGTALGIFTFVILSRDSVRRMFENQALLAADVAEESQQA